MNAYRIGIWIIDALAFLAKALAVLLGLLAVGMIALLAWERPIPFLQTVWGVFSFFGLIFCLALLRAWLEDRANRPRPLQGDGPK